MTNGAESELSAELIGYYRQVLATHSPKGEQHVCAVCQVARCPDWADAYDKLAAAGQLMAAPDQKETHPAEDAPWRR